MNKKIVGIVSAALLVLAGCGNSQANLSKNETTSLRNTNICDTNQCQYNLWVNWLVHKIV